ncbi:hypothetical protein PR048_026665 [Dryococelus australis]|uniref:AN1-type domain-containing protein n=1 Tax=Dryococelus australis TaxID=614101 RepID=A0ABQ9GLZ3_9NEOP|nr:hypothetical protein PR048_026665 [Dryococelus australis]
MEKKSLSAYKNENCGSDVEIDKCTNMLQEFLKDESRMVCHFPCKLTSYARMRLHSQSEKLGLKHYAEGTADQRHLVVEKVANHIAAASLDSLSHSVVERSDSRCLGDDNKSIKPGDKLLNPELQEYGHLDEVPFEKNDILNSLNDPCKITVDPSALQYAVLGNLSEPHCENTGDEEAEVKKLCSGVPCNEHTNGQPPRSKRHRNRKKADVPRPGAGGNRIKKGAEETDDEVLHRFQQDNKMCAQGSCGKGTELFGQLCQHCCRMYCLAHCIPEVHGCSEAAHAHARSSFLKPPPRPTDPIKHGFADRKLKAKLGEMSQKRKPKKK